MLSNRWSALISGTDTDSSILVSILHNEGIELREMK